MANIRVDSPIPVFDGQPLTFKSPANCSQVSGLIVYFPNGNETASRTFQFVDAHGNQVGGKDLFASNVLVKVLLDTDLNRAYVQNADTNAYLEAQLASKRPNTWTPTAQEVGARPNTWMPSASDVGARPNTWTPTAAQVGAVPTGRKVNGKALSSDISLNASDVGARPNTWLPTPKDISAEPAIEDSSHPGCYYRMVSGVKEWINPPMIAGVEYRTTKRYNGNPVYTKNIDCGTMPVGSSSGSMTATVSTGTNHLKITNWYIYMVSGDELCNFPMISSGEIAADAWVSHAVVYLRSWRDYSTYYAHTIIEYIK